MVCKFKSGLVAAFPAASKVDVKVFTMKNCSFCKPVLKKVNKMAKQMKDIINVNEISLDDEWQKYPDVRGAPTVQVGREKFSGAFDQSQLWAAIFNNIDRGGSTGAVAASAL